MTDRYALGNAYEKALKAVNDHIGDCSTCAWLGDYCAKREVRMGLLFGARTACLNARATNPLPAGKHTIKYFVHELNDTGEVISSVECTNQMEAVAFKSDFKKGYCRVERATLNEHGVVVNKEDVT